jgi:hypothetical protein
VTASYPAVEASASRWTDRPLAQSGETGEESLFPGKLRGKVEREQLEERAMIHFRCACRWAVSKTPKRLAKAVLICGLVSVLGVLLFLFVTSEREKRFRAQDASNLERLVLAMHDHNDTYGCCPAAKAYSTRDGKPGLSWRVALLPFLQEEALFEEFKLDEPWDSPNNIQLLSRMPPIYQLPGKRETGGGLTHYQVFVGPGTPFAIEEGPWMKEKNSFLGGPRIPGSFQEGTSNTVFIATARKPVPWTKPEDLPYVSRATLPPLGWPGRRGFHIATADAKVHWIDDPTGEIPKPVQFLSDAGDPGGPAW